MLRPPPRLAGEPLRAQSAPEAATAEAQEEGVAGAITVAVEARMVVEAAPVVVAGTAEVATPVVDTGAAEATAEVATPAVDTGAAEATAVEAIRVAGTGVVELAPGAMSLEVRTALAAATASSAIDPPAWIMTGQHRDRNTASELR